MEHLPVSDQPYLRVLEFDILAKCFLIHHNIENIHSQQPFTWDWLESVDDDLRKVKPWWLVHIHPSMVAIEEGDPFHGGKISICTYSHMSLPGEENYSHKAIFEGNPKDFDLENCLNEYFPNLKNKKSCKAAIKSYATYLGLGIIGIETGAGGQQTGSISIMIDDNPVDMGLLEDVKIRARTSAYLKHKITLFEHTQRPQIISVANLDAWINSGCVFEKNYPTFTSEMANLANRFLEIDRHSLADRQTILNKYFDIINSTPEFVAPRVNFAHFFRRFRLLPQALQSIRWALELAPEDRDAWITAACIYSDSGDWENAKECFINALSLSIGPSRQEVIEYLSRLP